MKIVLAVIMAGCMVQSAKMVMPQCTVQFSWLIFQVCLHFVLTEQAEFDKGEDGKCGAPLCNK